jgi:hypothetical protein
MWIPALLLCEFSRRTDAAWCFRHHNGLAHCLLSVKQGNIATVVEYHADMQAVNSTGYRLQIMRSNKVVFPGERYE